MRRLILPGLLAASGLISTDAYGEYELYGAFYLSYDPPYARSYTFSSSAYGDGYDWLKVWSKLTRNSIGEEKINSCPNPLLVYPYSCSKTVRDLCLVDGSTYCGSGRGEAWDGSQLEIEASWDEECETYNCAPNCPQED